MAKFNCTYITTDKYFTYVFNELLIHKCKSDKMHFSSLLLFFTDNLNFATVTWCLHRTENSVSLQSLGSVQHTYNKLLTCLIWALLTGSRVHGIFLSRLCVCVNLHKNNLKKKNKVCWSATWLVFLRRFILTMALLNTTSLFPRTVA